MTNKRRKLLLFTSPIIGILIGISIGAGFFYPASSAVNTRELSSSTTIAPLKTTVCFTPPRGCTSLILKAIEKAKDSILVHAYSLTCKSIATSLIKAHEKGIKVQIIVDKGQSHAHHSQVHKLANAGISVHIDKVNGLAHNKIIIIDQQMVITGSFNFSAAADTRNAENVILMDNFEIANLYTVNWQRRMETSYPLSPRTRKE